MIRSVLSDDSMPRQRFQNPQIRQSKNGSYFIRPWVDVVTAAGLERRKKTIVLGTQEWFNAKQNERSRATRLGLRNIISGIFERAIAWSLYTGPNPIRGVRIFGQNDSRQKSKSLTNRLATS